MTQKAILENALAVTKARQSAVLSQKQLSKISHVPQSTIARIEYGHNTGIENISKLVLGKKLTISISNIIGELKSAYILHRCPRYN